MDQDVEDQGIKKKRKAYTRKKSQNVEKLNYALEQAKITIAEAIGIPAGKLALTIRFSE